MNKFTKQALVKKLTERVAFNKRLFGYAYENGADPDTKLMVTEAIIEDEHILKFIKDWDKPQPKIKIKVKKTAPYKKPCGYCGRTFCTCSSDDNVERNFLAEHDAL